MSCDVDLWGKKRPVLSRLLPSAEGWKKDEDGWLLEKRNWLLRASRVAGAEPMGEEAWLHLLALGIRLSEDVAVRPQGCR